MIPEPQRTYLLELLFAIGQAADDFIVVGGQALKFYLDRPRATRDIDFVLNVVSLREHRTVLSTQLQDLGYVVVEGSQNFQFDKPIPNSKERMRIEFMAPAEFKRRADFRVDVEVGLHARACTGGAIAVQESDLHALAGHLPNGKEYTAQIRVTRPHALVMLKLLALDDRYRNERGLKESQHDREEARVHAADIVAIISASLDPKALRESFEKQFAGDPLLGVRVLSLTENYFRENTSPGLLVYEEFLASNVPVGSASRRELQAELERAHIAVSALLPPRRLYQFVRAVDQCCAFDQDSSLRTEYLHALQESGISISDPASIGLLPTAAFAGTHSPGEVFVANVSEELGKLGERLSDLLHAYRSEERRVGKECRSRWSPYH